ncbi:uncharacterized protein LOC109722433 isoform X2 [Ananas comosus]|uniref:Uncharacterized protein LOC109722433 isoform X2 n=1 Tax=Ananas comosus TaxID=4615 RepID=A0A6P5GBU5_ANACO|nr:uncharacterized protein LOC109722433 isoform X2 [Ananas comosus]
MATEKEIALLSRVAANHLFLGQFEALRASLLSLRKRSPELALAILRTIVHEGGGINGVLFSSTCNSPSHLAWLSALELPRFDSGSPIGSSDHKILRLKVEFLLLIQVVVSRVSELLKRRTGDGDLDDKGEIAGVDENCVKILNRILDLGARRLKRDIEQDSGLFDEVSPVSEDDLKPLWKIFLEYADIFDALCGNIHKQIQLSEPLVSELAVGTKSGEEGSSSSQKDTDVLAAIQRNVQLSHLDALSQCVKADDFEGAFSHLRFLHLDYGVEETEYRFSLRELIIKVWRQNSYYGETQLTSCNRMVSMYVEMLSSSCIRLVQMIQLLQDEVLSEEIEQHRISDASLIPLPLKKFLQTLAGEKVANADGNISTVAIRSFMRDLYHYARNSKTHVLKLIVDTSLSAISREQLEEANDIVSLFPLLQPLVAVLGWDLLSGKTALRRKLMWLFWTSKSQALQSEEYSHHGKQTEETSCVEYLCDLLCFHLDLARYVAIVNSGQSWDSKNLLCLSHKEQVIDDSDAALYDPFVENLILNSLAVQTPMRVLFDVVPGIKFQDAFDLISMQPFPSKSSAWKRVQDIELMHMRFALEFTVFAIGAMELCPGDKNDYQFATAVFFLREMQNHLEAISNVSRKIFMVSIISSLLHMDNVSINLTQAASCGVYPVPHERLDRDITTEGRNNMAVSFVGLLLEILRRNLPLPSAISEIERSSNTVLPTAGRKALEWRLSNAKHFLEDWEWRLSVLQCLRPVSGLRWGWKEALVFLRATPSKLLNLCMQRAKYDIAEEAVQRFSLPPEDKVALQMAEWVEDTLSHVAEGTPNAVRKLDILSFRTQLGPLATILLCIDVAASSARSRDMCKLLLDQARSMLSEIFPGRSPKIGSAYWDQIQEVAIISVTKRILQRLHDLLEQETSLTLRETFAGEMAVSTPNESSRIGQRQRALVILHQMIDDAFKGKRQFLSGKLHNLARVVTDEDAETNYPKGEGFDYDKKGLFSSENGVIVGLGLRVLKQVTKPALKTSPSVAESSSEIKDSAKRLFGPITTKPSAYLSNFIIYVATIGDIVDGIDTTHDFNFFSLVYEWPKDLLTRLMFERGSIDAAGKVADVMGVDFVHQVISACVPPVFPSRSTHGWACIPFVPMDSGSKLDLTKTDTYGAASAAPQKPLYPLQPNVVNNLAKFSPVRAILACTFGSRMLLSDSELAVPGHLKDALGQAPDTERLFSEFVLEQSERFPTLIRWIQMQSNLHRVSESAVTAKSNNEAAPAESKEKVHLKRIHDSESDTESNDDGEVIGSHFTSTSQSHTVSDSQLESPAPCDNVKHDLDVYISFDSENEGSLKNRVERFIQEGKLMDALALSDRFLRNGASDRLLHLLIEREEENNPVLGGYGSRKFGSTTWQYCLRLTDKQLAARVALKYLHRWDLHAAIDVLTMCSCHLPESDLRNEVLQRRQALQKYSHILSADDHYSSWQEVEAECKRDSEGLALRLAAKGAVSAALEVAESPSTSIDLRRELQGRQLVKLLTTDPLSGGGPAEASRFLSSLRDSNEALPVAMGAMQLLPDLRSKQLLVHFFLKRTVGNLSDTDIARLNSWALGLRVLALLPLPSQQRCSALHEHPQLILEVLLMMKQLEDAALILKEVPSLRNDNLIRSYAEKAIAINVDSAPRVQRISISGSGSKQKGRAGTSTSRSNFAQSKGNLLREARRSVSWASRDTGNKSAAKDVYRKRKSSGIAPTERVPSEALGGIPDERASSYSFDGQERHPFVPVTEEWVLTGDHNTDEKIRSSHKYKTSPDITLFKALLSLCSDEAVSAKGALELCVSQMKIVLSSQHLPPNASMETASRAYHATETYVQALAYAKSQLRKFSGSSDLSSNSERSRDADDASADSASSSTGSQCLDELSELLAQADIWLGRAELLQSLLGSGIVASLDDIADKESSAHLRDRLIQEERYSVAVYTCKKCKIDAFPVWNAWGRALIRMEHYAQARVKYKQALQLYKGDVSPVILEIINTVEGGPPVDVLSARSMYEHFAKSASTILDDSLSADAYLNILYMPSTFPRSERSRQSRDASEVCSSANASFHVQTWSL